MFWRIYKTRNYQRQLETVKVNMKEKLINLPFGQLKDFEKGIYRGYNSMVQSPG